MTQYWSISARVAVWLPVLTAGVAAGDVTAGAGRGRADAGGAGAGGGLTALRFARPTRPAQVTAKSAARTGTTGTLFTAKW